MLCVLDHRFVYVCMCACMYLSVYSQMLVYIQDAMHVESEVFFSLAHLFANPFDSSISLSLFFSSCFFYRIPSCSFWHMVTLSSSSLSGFRRLIFTFTHFFFVTFSSCISFVSFFEFLPIYDSSNSMRIAG